MRSRLEPVIKWPGSKRPIAGFIARLLAPGGDRYFEPFVGGGAVLGAVTGKSKIAGDVIPELVGIWNLVKSNPDRLIGDYRASWQELQRSGHSAYYEIRDRFNEHRDPSDLLFLSRTCVNGLIRFNRQGEFNNSLHHTRPGINPDRLARIIRAWNLAVKDTEFYVADFSDTLAMAVEGDVAYLDPPYLGTRGRYHPIPFDHGRLWDELERLNRIGVRWVLSLDGSAGDREYTTDAVPTNLYVMRVGVSTGQSPFVRLMRHGTDEIVESVFLNFDPAGSSLSKLPDEWGQLDAGLGSDEMEQDRLPL